MGASGRDRHLEHPVQAVFKDAVAFFNVGKRAAVSNERRGIDLALFDQTQGFGAVAAIHPAGFENQVFAVLSGSGSVCGPS